MPYFAAAGYDCWAVSLRAQGGSGGREGARGGVAGTLDTHASDLGSVVGALPGEPVMVAHSFGGLIAQE
jgi:pimeloyl-ACP methyl ester carboxylesterase